MLALLQTRKGDWMRILLAEDERSLSRALIALLERNNYSADAVYDGEEALAYLEAGNYDALILDIMMPKLDGRSVCRALRRTQDVPILFLTALSDEEDTLLGYELGADDYITKPFHLSVVYAKTMALIRRSRGSVRAGDRMALDGLALSLSAQKVYLDGRDIPLTPKEYALLHCLMAHRGQVLSREQLLRHGWGYDYQGDDRAVDTHIRRLREKLGPWAGHIRTVIKAGYRLEG